MLQYFYRMIPLRISYLYFLVALVGVFSFFSLSAQAVVFSRTLKMGDKGEDVRSLQQILNSSADTQVAAIGIGSKGQETDTFGSKTHSAVLRFQAKYRTEILDPAGLSAPTGIVGPATRNKLNSFDTVSFETPAPLISSLAPAPEPPVYQSVPTQSNTVSANPNTKRVEEAIAIVDSIGKKQGFDTAKLQLAKDALRAQAATTTDLTAQFLSVLAKSSKPLTTLPKISLLEKSQQNASNLLVKIGLIKPAQAQAGIPFGGYLVFPFYCTCSYNWLVTITPLPPSFAVLLSYYEGTQIYANYTLPFATAMLGFYSTGAQCAIYYGYGCATIPTEGLIYGFVGSSL